jgi:hypothetical protein
MFEWGGGCLWPGNDATYERFGVGVLDDEVGLSERVLARLAELAEWHDGALDWSDPAGPSPWSAEDFNRFDAAAEEVIELIRSELGAEFDVVYEQLGRP